MAIIADSINLSGDRITSFVVEFPRYILAEVNTHRAFSRNSASSRAVPFEKMLQRVISDPFIPSRWMKDHKGMQGSEYFSLEEGIEFIGHWLQARDSAVEHAVKLNKIGLTKQMANRLLEPFMKHTAIITATDFENFFALRCDTAADIHFQTLAYGMLNDMRESKPKLLKDGEWHIPFGSNIKHEEKIRIATARCARVSYINYEGNDDYEADLKLYDNLLKSGHMSPFEHCALARSNYGYIGNFKGFVQLRKTLKNESRRFQITP